MFHCGPFRISDTGEKITDEKDYSPELKKNVMADAYIYQVKGPKDCSLELAYQELNTGERYVRARKVEGPKALRRLGSGRKKLMVQKHRQLDYVALRQVYFNKEDKDRWLRWRTPDLEELNRGAGLNVENNLLESGALNVNTKEKLLQSTARDRRMLCTIFRRGDRLPPVIAYVLTRILPVYYEFEPQPRLF